MSAAKACGPGLGARVRLIGGVALTAMLAAMPAVAQDGGKSDVKVTMPGNRPTLCTADGQNCIALTSRLHLDAAAYDTDPDSRLDSGASPRRAQIGIIGTFMKDWEYSLVYDAGGSSGGAFLTTSNRGLIDTAYVAYKGFKPVTIIGGFFETPYTLDSSTSSNNITFMERATPQQVAAGIAAGTARSNIGAYANGSNWWVGGFFTGRAIDTDQADPSQLGSTLRGVWLPVLNDNASLLIGGDVQYLYDPGPNPPVLRLRDRIELRVDPTRILDTGNIAAVDGASVYSAELAGNFGPLYFQGEYFWFEVERAGALADLSFEGGYFQASLALTGEKRSYSASSGSYGGINPKSPFQAGKGWGAFEIAARYSYMDLTDLDIDGGTQTNTTLGLNWYPNRNLRFMFNYINGKVDFATKTDVEYQAVGVRTQVAF